jgi:hypothetical protein
LWRGEVGSGKGISCWPPFFIQFTGLLANKLFGVVTSYEMPELLPVPYIQ